MTPGKTQAHISFLLTSQLITSLTLRLVFCEMEMSFTPSPGFHGGEMGG